MEVWWIRYHLTPSWGFPGGSDYKGSAYNMGDPGLIPGLGRSPGKEHGNPLEYSCLEKSMDRGAWQATVHGVTKSRTRLSDFTFSLTPACELTLKRADFSKVCITLAKEATSHSVQQVRLNKIQVLKCLSSLLWSLLWLVSLGIWHFGNMAAREQEDCGAPLWLDSLGILKYTMSLAHSPWKDEVTGTPLRR